MFNMNAIESAAYPLQMFFFIKTHFDILFRIAKKKATKWKHYWKIFVGGKLYPHGIWIQSESNSCFVGTLKENQSNFNLIA